MSALPAWRLTLLALALPACATITAAKDTTTPTDEADVDTDSDTDADTDSDTDSDADADTATSTTDTATTGPQPYGNFEPYYITWGAQFGWDGSALADVDLYGSVLPPTIDIYLGVEPWEAAAFDFARTDLYCTVSLPLTDSTAAPWVDGVTTWYGTEWDITQPAITNCDDVDHLLTMDGRALLADLQAQTWGAGIGPQSANLQYWLTVYGFGAYTTDPTWMGGVIRSDFIGTDDVIYSFVYEVDASMAVLFDAAGYAMPMAAPDVRAAGGGINRGWYTMNGFFLYILK